MILPPTLLKLGTESIENREWLESLPATVRKLQTRWNLQIDRPYFEHLSCSYVAPCTMQDTQRAILKIGLPHEEALHEIEGLQVLNGSPTVHLLDFDKETNSMLLEPCFPGTHLKTTPPSVQDEVVSKMLLDVEYNFVIFVSYETTNIPQPNPKGFLHLCFLCFAAHFLEPIWCSK